MSTQIFTLVRSHNWAVNHHPELSILAADRLNPADTLRTYGAVDLTGESSIRADAEFWGRVGNAATDKQLGNAKSIIDLAKTLVRRLGTAGVSRLPVNPSISLPAGLPDAFPLIYFLFDARYVCSVLASLPAETRPSNGNGLRDAVKTYARENGRAGLLADLPADAVALARQLLPGIFDAYAPAAAPAAPADQPATETVTPQTAGESLPTLDDLTTALANVETTAGDTAIVLGDSTDLPATDDNDTSLSLPNGSLVTVETGNDKPANRRDKRNAKRQR